MVKWQQETGGDRMIPKIDVQEYCRQIQSLTLMDDELMTPAFDRQPREV